MTSAEGQRGFTLLETLIAFLILAGALSISAQTIAVAARSISLSNERTEVLSFVKALRLETALGVLRDGRDKEGARLGLKWNISYRSVVRAGTVEGARFAFVVITTPSGREHKFIYFETDRQNIR